MTNKKQVCKMPTHLIGPHYLLIYKYWQIYFSHLPAENLALKTLEKVNLKILSAYVVCCIYN